MALSSFVRRVSGSILPLPIRSVLANVQNQRHNFVGRQLIPYLRFSTSIDSEVLRVLDSEISTSSNSTQVEGIGAVPFKVDEEYGTMSLKTLDDENTIFETKAHYDEKTGHDPQVCMSGTTFKGNPKVEYSFEVQRDDVIVNELTMRNMALSSFVRRVSPKFLGRRLSVETMAYSAVSPKAFSRASLNVQPHMRFSTSSSYSYFDNECLWMQAVLGNSVDVRKRISYHTSTCELELHNHRFVLYINPKNCVIQDLGKAYAKSPHDPVAHRSIQNIYLGATYYYVACADEPNKNAQCILDKLARDYRGRWDGKITKKIGQQPSKKYGLYGGVKISSDWKFPEPGSQKSNSDGSFQQGKEKSAAYIGHGTSSSVLRDDKGDPLMACILHLDDGRYSSHYFEVAGAYNGAMMTLLHSKNFNLAMEVDCLRVIEQLVRDTPNLQGSTHEWMIMRLRLLYKLKWGKIILLHAPRKNNAVADMLAEAAYKMPIGFHLIKPEKLPLEILKQIDFEKKKNNMT